MSSEDKVIAFPNSTEVPECTLTIERPPINLCRHERITLDTHTRLIRCTSCSQVFDPFSYMMSNATTITRAWADYESMKRRILEKENSIEALAKEEKRLKSRVKTLKDKVEPGIEIRGECS